MNQLVVLLQFNIIIALFIHAPHQHIVYGAFVFKFPISLPVPQWKIAVLRFVVAHVKAAIAQAVITGAVNKRREIFYWSMILSAHQSLLIMDTAEFGVMRCVPDVNSFISLFSR